ncbi:MAG: fumarylacetoacetate hydrolase family protein [Elusimicrobia bacterium]|nr:fumarylacetoacetate hydrolase family protein [Elusimicrobiota bacterium]
MKLVTYEVATPQGPVERVGALRGDEIAELGGGDMVAFLDGGEAALKEARRILETRPKGSGLPLKGVRLKAPLKPRFLRDFFAFEDHAKAGAARRQEPLQKEWYDQPVYYKGNPRELYGPGDVLPWPAFTRKLDFEFEIAAVVGKKGRDISVADAPKHIAGYVVMNDCSARDIQKNEMVCRMGPAKGKDFATALGPWLVTADERPTGEIPPLAVRVNGEEWSRSNGIQPYWSFAVMLSHASQGETMLPGDILGSGTYFKGCGLDQDRWIKPGDELELDAGPLGVLKNKVGAPAGSTHLKYNRDGSYAT